MSQQTKYSKPQVEYVIVDGKSDDGSIDTILNNKNFITKYLTEKDKGIAEAFNKGIDLSSGDYLYFLN